MKIKPLYRVKVARTETDLDGTPGLVLATDPVERTAIVEVLKPIDGNYAIELLEDFFDVIYPFEKE